MSDPQKSYHLEFVCTDEDKARQLQSVIQGFDIEAKIVLRKKYYVVYLKEGSGIVDLLNVCEAPIAPDEAGKPEDCERNAQFCESESEL